MKKTFLLLSGILIGYFLSAQSMDEPLNISIDDGNGNIKVDVNDGYDRDVQVYLFEDGHFSHMYDLNTDAVSIEKSIGVVEYNLIIDGPQYTSNFGMATVVDVDRANPANVNQLNNLFNLSCGREEVKYFLIDNILFEKQCVCSQFDLIGSSQFYALWSMHQLDEYLIGTGCQADEKGTTLGKMANPDPTGGYIVAKDNSLELSDKSAEMKTYTIYDMTGKFITGKVCCDNNIDVSMLSRGLYVIKVSTKDKQETYKFIK